MRTGDATHNHDDTTDNILNITEDTMESSNREDNDKYHHYRDEKDLTVVVDGHDNDDDDVVDNDTGSTDALLDNNNNNNDDSGNITVHSMQDDDDDDNEEEDNVRKMNRFGSDEFVKNRDYDTFIWKVPDSFERFFAPYDDTFIRICQHFHSRPVIWFSRVISAFTVIEIGMTLPFLCFMLGWDGPAQMLLSIAFALALIPQLPKRFLWRPRPFMVGRALKFGNEKTSSLPSRAVTCSVAYSFMALYFVRTYLLSDVSLWGTILFWISAPVVIGLAAVMASFSRINIGVHYPSDCLLGALQGLLCCLVGLLLYSVHFLLCPSCMKQAGCYAWHGTAFTLNNLSRFNWILFILVSVACVLLSIILVVRPVNFYTKFHHIFGMILPCELFQLCLLCKPLSLNGESALALSKTLQPNWHSYVMAIVSSVALTLIGVKTGKGQISILIFCFMYVTVFALLFFWRAGYMNDYPAL